MAKVKVYNLQREKRRRDRTRRRRLRRRGQRSTPLRGASRRSSPRVAPARPRPRAAPRSRGSTPQALQAEGHRPRASGLDPRAAVRRRRQGARPAAAQLRVPSAAQDARWARSRSALSLKLKEGQLIVVDDFQLAGGQDQGSCSACSTVLNVDAGALIVDASATRTCACRRATCPNIAVPAARGRQRLRRAPPRAPGAHARTQRRRSKSASTRRPEDDRHAARRHHQASADAHREGQRLRETQNQYLFEVERRANKIEIRQAVEKLFNVKVDRRAHADRARPHAAHGSWPREDPNWKKAIVAAEGRRHDRVLRGSLSMAIKALQADLAGAALLRSR